MNLDDLKKLDLQALDWKNVGSFPIAIRAVLLVGVFLAICAGGYFAAIKDALETWDRAKAEEVSLRSTYSDRANKATNLDAYKAQLQQMDRQFGELLRQLPGRTEIENLVEEIAREALSSNLKQELFKPQNEQIKEFYAELPIQVRVVGNYHDMGAFASDLGQLSRIVTLNDVTISAAKDGGQLQMDATARTFRYLDDEEVAAQRKSSKAAKAPKK